MTEISEAPVKKIRSTSRHSAVGEGGGGAGVGSCRSCLGVMLLNELGPKGRKDGSLTPSIRREEPRWSYRKKQIKSFTFLLHIWFELHRRSHSATLWIDGQVGVKGHKKNRGTKNKFFSNTIITPSETLEV